MPTTSISSDAVRQATGQGWDAWFPLLDGYDAKDHTARVKRLQADHPELSGWWAQSIVVEWEKARGHRVEGESCKGDFQVSCSKTVAGDASDAWARLMDHGILSTGDWRAGAQWETPDAAIEVCRVDPGKMLRWFWSDQDGKSTVEVGFQARGDKTSVTVRHHGLASDAAREVARRRWKAVLEDVFGTD